MSGLLPARLAHAEDGTPFSETYDDIYHSADGGPGQARHVFLQGNELPHRWSGRDRFVILETGFGSGLNFLATWDAWRDDPRRCGHLHYLAVEKHPFATDDLVRLHGRWPEFDALSRELVAAWPPLTPGFHRLELACGRVVLTLLLGEVDSVLRHCDARVDAFYLDGFDPKKNPAMWSPELLRHLARLAAPTATLATWCVAGQVREDLRAAGFEVAKRPGFGRKRHMLAAGLMAGQAPAWHVAAAHERRAVVLGAGLAGCAIAERLTARGWSVTVVERHAHSAGEASGNIAGIVRPMLSRDDNLVSRLNRACFLHARRAWAALERAGFASRRNLDGVLQIARDAAHERQMRNLLIAGTYPDDYARFLERRDASQRLGCDTAFGAWLFPAGGWANPPSLCRAMLAAGGERITFLGDRETARIERDATQWRLLDGDDQLIAAAPVLILAVGAATRDLAPELPITLARGQVSHIRQGLLPDFHLPACCDGYLTPAVDGIHCVGASYADDAGLELREDEHVGNLARLERILPGVLLDPTSLDGRVGFRATTPDRLPLVGALADAHAKLPHDLRLKDVPRQEGLYGLLGLGSRGLVWATLAAEILASRLNGDPSPVETDLLDAIDPARFLLRAHRRR
ncbi:MAG: bifunctional tRNA (5-methylaminomethyl-2-thiouridine)(34)-methyltransferase MnmD/FAD-dependent 5-carboxymethylaminomethyl-2-thiouridine(34) oxidoreductase MnmC [Pseudomonadota bacterium]|nr:bifunctional tRNA (5-methylaminomethyl-2-thiouridine)(34)-methyltransferase MnmD/FAD-dependent 5-carboxymethylaminomethyl-2-thiouridine(34) oxidoreductase MnmC [Pseudomonadota bacterium]MDP1572992.1 bifunctional tRNA (5-methylaminomethyl-2-thiouridine)(34)-methyltransferase MnmD/FAD-dependent 5-carboxymethylaminomethyl-2-thiouridine(34) oxidoreductase MnmC [Pseudomonadota bacterium]MDP1903150.1 bifunctional tRNA (5-methylaminomethyl-2-thiouridine)(34)-methyltransferase MnmD/FAD-dependent 5-car